jgi:PAS domain S-box-containing protein
MTGATLQAALSFLICAAIAVYVASAGGPSRLRDPLLGYLAAIMVWTAGVVWRFSAASEASAEAGFFLGWVGATLLPLSWLFLTGRYARIEILERHSRLWLALVFPMALSWVALATNDRHGLFLSEFSQHAETHGPLFFATLVFGYSYGLVAIFLFLREAARTFLREWKFLGALVVLSLIGPMVCHVLFVSRWSPLPYDTTPAALGFMAIVLTFTIFRNHLLDMLPMARRDVIDHLREGVLIGNVEGVILDANPAAEEILDLSGAEIRGRRIGELLSGLIEDGERRAALEEAFEALPEGLTLPASELRPSDGRRIQMTAKALDLAEGGVAGRFAVLRDCTQEHQYEHFARQVQRLETVGSLAAGIAHEVNNPLAFLRSNLYHVGQVIGRLEKQRDRLPERDADDLSELQEVVAECSDGIDRIGRIVNSMRRISREPADDLAEVDVNLIVRESVRLSDLHRNRHVDIRAHLEPDLPKIRASAQRLTQVVVNLLLNAKQALSSHPDAVVTVETRPNADGVDIEVRDNGPGIAPEVRHRIFDPFFTTKGPEEGTGLGLSIAFDIVREHGGILEVVSREGAGACFVAHLPAHPDAPFATSGGSPLLGKGA